MCPLEVYLIVISSMILIDIDRGAEELCGGVWRSVVECGGVWWSVVECGRVMR